METYFQEIEQKINEIYKIAKKARSLGRDPEFEPEIPQAGDLASRVEKLVGPPRVAEVIRELDKKMPREELALKLVEMIVDGKFGKLNEEKAAEQAIRTALAVLTEGIVIAPLEGITEVKIKRNFDGTPYLALYFASPIRAAGGTAAALAVLAGDFARRKLYLSPYKSDEKEARRFAEEVEIYHASIAREQYKPSEADILFAVHNLPVEITGEPTEKDVSVTAYRDLERIGHNFVRGGAVLALTEGVMQKASKIMKYVSKLNIDGWGWLADIQQISKAPAKDENAPVFPKGETYLGEVIAGRPVFSHPGTEGHRGREGGFRLRYGRSRNTGIAAIGVHPATMVICDDFLAIGTQLKTERPGKGGAVVPVDSIEGPVVKLKDGSVVQVNSVKEALKIRNKVEEILFLGDILVSFGEFLENNHPLMPAGYSEEWWSQEVARALIGKRFDTDLTPYCSPPYPRPSPHLAIRISEELGVPLHPAYTYPYHDFKVEELGELGKWLAGGEPEFEKGGLKRIRVSLDQTPKRLLEELGVPHKVDGEHVLVEEHALPLCRCLGLPEGQRLTRNRLEGTLRSSSTKDVMEIIQTLAGFSLRKKAPTRIGARMGRPEKANPRKMKPPVHVLFPVGMRGGTTRNLVKAAEKEGETYVEVVMLECPKCGSVGLTRKCQNCGTVSKFVKTCSKCKRPITNERCPTCNVRGEFFNKRGLDLKSLFEAALERLQEERPELVKGVQGMTSEYKIPEPIEKGVLRAKHNVYVFKDGTVRFDATNVPLTHFKPREVGTPIERLRELGYTKDIHGKPIENDEQVVELKVQDVIISKAGAEYLLSASRFVDELLQKFYGLPSYYNANSLPDLVGHMVIGLAPHTSVGIAGRIIGFTDASVGYAHPFFHAAKRRDCVHPSTRLLIWDEDHKQLRIERIGKLVDELMNKFPEKTRLADFHGTQILDNPYNWYAISIDPKTHVIVRRKITRFLKGPPPKYWVKFTTSTNRDFISTPDHHLLYFEGEELKAKKMTDVRVEDKVPIATRLLLRDETPSSINLVKELLRTDEKLKKEVKIRGADDFFKMVVKKVGRNKVLESLRMPKYLKKTLRGWYSSVPLSHFEVFVKKDFCKFEDLPNEAVIGLGRDDFVIPSKIPLGSGLMRVLGFYLAEGHARSNGSCYQVSFRTFDKNVAGALIESIKRAFGVKVVKENETKFTICSKIVYLLFTKVWRMGKNARTKRVPKFVYSLSGDLIQEFLSGYFDGNGTVLKSPKRLAFYSINKELLQDIATLLLRNGIFSRYAEIKLGSPGKKLLQKLKFPRETTLYHLKLYGRDLREFARICDSRHPLKRARIESLRKTSVRPTRYIRMNGKTHKMQTFSDFTFDSVKSINQIKDDVCSYCVDVKTEDGEITSKNVLWSNQLFQVRCDGDEDCVMLLLDALLNFSKRFLPSKRGGTMDAPLIFSTRINPTEIDKEAHNMDVMTKYPIEFYEATQHYAKPVEVAKLMETVEQRLGAKKQYEELEFSVHTNEIAAGPYSSRYKTLETMEEKISAQLGLARRIRAVDERDVAERIIEHHFIPDLKGNLRKFATQKFRCVSCNSIHRRVPLNGVCARCGGKLILTVTRGGVEKYLQVAMQVADEYDVSDYTKQRLNLTQYDIKSMFESDAHRQLSLADFL